MEKVKTGSEGFSEANLRDLALLEKAKSGDRASFEALYRKYAPFIRQEVYFSVRNSKMTEDIVQDIMSKVWSKLDKYRVEHTFSAWVWRIVKNHMVDHHRRSRNVVLSTSRNIAISNGDGEDESSEVQMTVCESSIEGDSGMPDSGIAERDMKALVGRLLSSVSERERRILEMYFYEDMSYAEIAQELEVPLGTMKVLLMRAKEKLRGRSADMAEAKSLLALR